MESPPRIAIVVPCFNEQEVLPSTVPQLLCLFDDNRDLFTPDSFIMLVDDGSSDRTWDIISDLHDRHRARVKAIRLSANRGHQTALLAGLHSVQSRCDAAVSIDADLQDPPSAIPEMVRLFVSDGAEVVYGVRRSRAVDSWFKRRSARAFYRLQQSLGVNTVFDHADFRLLSARALSLLAQYPERNLFLRGIVPQLGLPTAVLAYDRAPRAAGESKYPLSRMLSLAVDGITSFSAKPLRLIFILGLLLLCLDVAVGIYVLWSYFLGSSVSGWVSLMLSVWFLGSLMLISLGIVGEYVGKIYIESKCRPRYFIQDSLDDNG